MTERKGPRIQKELREQRGLRGQRKLTKLTGQRVIGEQRLYSGLRGQRIERTAHTEA